MRHQTGRRRLLFAISVGIFWAAFGSEAAVAESFSAPSRAVADRPIQVREGGYVSSATCQACHPQEYASWRATYHRRMTQVASPESVMGNFDDVELRFRQKTYRLERREDEFWVEMDAFADESGRRSPPARVWKRVVMTTGSHYLQGYWLPGGNGRQLDLFPFFHRVDEGRWMPVDSIFLVPPDVGQGLHGGRWNRECINCHTTAGKRRLRDDGGMDTRVAEFGIACEACHGPAERHVSVNRDPARRYRLHLSHEPDPTISNPLRLPRERASQVCGQCHGVFTPVRDRRKEPDWNENGFAYRPGDDLNQTRVLMGHSDSLRVPAVRRYLEQHPGHLAARFWSDGMVRVTGREYNGLVGSPCFAGLGERKLSCLSCHVMHKSADDPRSMEDWANRLIAPAMDGDEACLQCHEVYRADVARHTHHRPDSEGSSCTNCHMPHTGYGLMKAVRSHQISSPSVAESLDVGRPNACNLCHLDRTLDWTGDHLEAWYGDPKPSMGERERTIAAGVLWLLQGDAGQRALTAWSAGWEPARRASGTDWIVPFLAQLLNDPYATVRFIANRSLRNQPGYGRLEFDATAPRKKRRAISRQVVDRWVSSPNPKRSRGSAILIEPDGSLQRELFSRLVQSRDDRPIELAE